MNDAAAVRSRILGAVRLDLVGPRPGEPTLRPPTAAQPSTSPYCWTNALGGDKTSPDQVVDS